LLLRHRRSKRSTPLPSMSMADAAGSTEKLLVWAVCAPEVRHRTFPSHRRFILQSDPISPDTLLDDGVIGFANDGQRGRARALVPELTGSARYGRLPWPTMVRLLLLASTTSGDPVSRVPKPVSGQRLQGLLPLTTRTMVLALARIQSDLPRRHETRMRARGAFRMPRFT
jgi:hypothetical protein